MYRKSLRLFLVVGVLASTALVLQPAHAGGALGSDGQCDVIDNFKHPLNSGRSTAPSDYWQCNDSSTVKSRGLLDLNGWSLDFGTTRLGFITAKWTLKDAPPNVPAGSPVTLLPAGFTNIDYAIEFQTTLQDTSIDAGYECYPERFNSGTPKNRVSLFKYRTSFNTSNGPCLGTSTPETELAGTSNGTRPNQDAVLREFNPRWRQDGMWVQLSVGFDKATNANVCGAQASCLAAGWGFGIHDEFSQITGVYEGFNHDSIVTKKGQPGLKASITRTGNTLQLQVPYRVFLPQSAPDDDLLLDEDRGYTLAVAGSTVVSSAVAQTSGVAQAGTPFRTCPFGPSLTPDGPASGVGYPQTVPVAGGKMPGADDGKLCRQGFVGAVTIQDWAPNSAMILRAYPRAPSWLPGKADCKYPVGFPDIIGNMPDRYGVRDTGSESSDYQAGFESSESWREGNAFTVGVPSKDWWIEPATATNNSNYVPVNPAASVKVPGVTGPNVIVAGVTGKNVACNYTYWADGLHNIPGQITPFTAS